MPSQAEYALNCLALRLRRLQTHRSTHFKSQMQTTDKR